MARQATTTKKKNSITVDFTGVETKSVLPEGEFICEVDSATLEEGEKGEFIKWEFKVADGNHKGKKAFTNTSLSQQSLWNLKRLLEAMGVETPEGQYDVDFDEVVGQTVGVVIEHDTYKGRTQSRVIDFFPAEGSTEPEEETAAEATDIPDDDAVDDMGKADLKELAEKLELDVELSGATSAQRRAMKKALAELREAKPEEKESAGRPTSKKKVTYKADDISTMSEEELDEVIEKHDLTIKDGLNLRKKRAAVTDALEETDLLVEEE